MNLSVTRNAMLKRAARTYDIPFEDYHYGAVEFSVPEELDRALDDVLRKHRTAMYEGYKKNLFDPILSEPATEGWSVNGDGVEGGKVTNLMIRPLNSKDYMSYDDWKKAIEEAISIGDSYAVDNLMNPYGWRTTVED